MDSPARVRQASREEIILLLAVGMPAGLLLLFLSSPWVLPGAVWLEVLCLAFIAFEGFALILLLRNFRRELVIDETSIRMLKDKVILWELPWQRYGGYRVTFQGPIRTGIPVAVEFLDVEGKPVGKACLIQRGFRFDPFTLMPVIKVLQDRVPEGGFSPPPVPDQTMKRPVKIYWALTALGVFLFVFGWKMMRDTELHRVVHGRELSGISPYEIVMMAGGMLVGVFSSFATLSPRRSFKALQPENLEGFMAVHSNSLSLDRLQPGKKYHYVDTGALRDNLDMYRRHAILQLVIGCGIFVFPVYILIDLWNSPFPFMFGLWAPIFSFFGILGGLFAILSARTLLACNKLRDSLGDQVAISAGQLEVSRAGKVTSYPLRSKERKGPFKVLFGARYLLFESGHSQYWLDPRFLEEA